MQKPARHPRRPPELTPDLKCQRTTNTVLHSTLEIRHSKFPSAIPTTATRALAGPVPRSPAERDRPHSGSGHLSRAVRRSGINQPTFSLHPPSHKSPGHIYVTLHALHDPQGNDFRPNGPSFLSPGQRPGSVQPASSCGLKGRDRQSPTLNHHRGPTPSAQAPASITPLFSRHQPSTFPMENARTRYLSLKLGVWIFLGHWSLVLGPWAFHRPYICPGGCTAVTPVTMLAHNYIQGIAAVTLPLHCRYNPRSSRYKRLQKRRPAPR
jgi:hypothetical protein